MAEGLARAMAPAGTQIYSAGVAPESVNPYAIEVMQEIGIDISEHVSKSPDDVPLHEVDCLISLCDHAKQSCPSLPGKWKHIHWSVEDPALVKGDPDWVRDFYRKTRDELKQRIEDYFSEN